MVQPASPDQIPPTHTRLMMHLFPEEALAYFRTHHGMATAAALAEAGLSRRQRSKAVDAGLLEPLYERVFHISSSPITLEARCAAISMAYPRGFITGPTGGLVMGLRRMLKRGPLHFCVPHGLHIGPFDGVRLRQTTKLPKAHVVTRGDGIRIASAARLAFDLAADVSAMDHRSVVEQLLNDGKCSMSTLGGVARELVHPARPGSARFVSTLLARSGRPVDSNPELLVLSGLRARDVPVVTQVEPLLLPGGRRLTLDLAVPSARWGVEIDVHPDHLLLDGTTRDKWRDRQCHRIDWQVERVTEVDLLDLDAICDELADLYHRRLRAVSRAA